MLTVNIFSVNIESLVLLSFRKFTACAEPEQTLVTFHPRVGSCSNVGMTAAEGYKFPERPGNHCRKTFDWDNT